MLYSAFNLNSINVGESERMQLVQVFRRVFLIIIKKKETSDPIQSSSDRTRLKKTDLMYSN